MKYKIRLIILASVIFLTAVLIGSYYTTKAVNSFFDKHYFAYHQMLTIKITYPLTIEKRKPVVQKIVLDYPIELINTPIKQYICDKFGPLDCKIALSIVQAESNFNELAIHVNSNSSVDLGCWQINFPTHVKTISPKDALDCYKATDWAFEKYKRDGNFKAWVTFSNGSYLLNL